MKTIDILAAVLVVIGALNWGLWGFFQFDLVATLFGGQSALVSRIVYSVVGIAGLYQALGLKGIQQRWGVRAHSAA